MMRMQHCVHCSHAAAGKNNKLHRSSCARAAKPALAQAAASAGSWTALAAGGTHMCDMRHGTCLVTRAALSRFQPPATVNWGCTMSMRACMQRCTESTLLRPARHALMAERCTRRHTRARTHTHARPGPPLVPGEPARPAPSFVQRHTPQGHSQSSTHNCRNKGACMPCSRAALALCQHSPATHTSELQHANRCQETPAACWPLCPPPLLPRTHAQPTQQTPAPKQHRHHRACGWARGGGAKDGGGVGTAASSQNTAAACAHHPKLAVQSRAVSRRPQRSKRTPRAPAPGAAHTGGAVGSTTGVCCCHPPRNPQTPRATASSAAANASTPRVRTRLAAPTTLLGCLGLTRQFRTPHPTPSNPTLLA
jgi:hypothetical protein